MTRFRLFDDSQLGEVFDAWEPNRRRGRASTVPAGSTYIVSNFPAFAWAEVIDTGNNATAASPADLASGSWVLSETGATSADANKLVTATAATRRNWNPWTRFRFYIGASGAATITEVRWWVGLFASDPSALTTLTTISGACFGYDTAIDGTVFWRCESSDATTAKLTTTDMPIVANGHYTGEIRMDNTNAVVDFYMAYHGLSSATKTASPLRKVATHSTGVPLAATPLLIGGTVTSQTTAAAKKRLAVGEVVLSMD